MIAIKRQKIPEYLEINTEKWTQQFLKTGNFNWHNVQKILLTELKIMSKNHCAFCDDLLFPLSGEIGEIEHFKPKELFKNLAYTWSNLFPICRRCNSTKNDRFDDLLLKPDANDYKFDDWFRLDPNTFELKPKKLGNPNWKRAEKTIELYGLCKEDKIARREFETIEINNDKYKNKDNQPFRYI